MHWISNIDRSCLKGPDICPCQGTCSLGPTHPHPPTFTLNPTRTHLHTLVHLHTHFRFTHTCDLCTLAHSHLPAHLHTRSHAFPHPPLPPLTPTLHPHMRPQVHSWLRNLQAEQPRRVRQAGGTQPRLPQPELPQQRPSIS